MGSTGRIMPPSEYTCREYREEMQLLALRRRLNDPSLSDAEMKKILAEIKRLETKMNMA